MINSKICVCWYQITRFSGRIGLDSRRKLAAARLLTAGLRPNSRRQRARAYSEQINIASSLTDKPFGVNIMLMSPFSDEVCAGCHRGKGSGASQQGPETPLNTWRGGRPLGLRSFPSSPPLLWPSWMTRLGASALIARAERAAGMWVN